MNKFRKAGWHYVNRHYGSKGIADIVAIRRFYNIHFRNWEPMVAFIQCKKEKKKVNHDEEKQKLIEFCGLTCANPIWAEKNWKNGRIKLTHVFTKKEFGLGKPDPPEWFPNK